MNCRKYHGRMREICEGTSGHSAEDRAEYLRLWERSDRFALGDWVAKIIKAVSFGTLKGTAGCGCDKRRKWLNVWWDRLTNRR